MTDKSKLSTESYKGVRDFYPEDLFVQHYIFNTWRKAVEKFGYVEYDASVLEPAELYRAKSGEEIVNDQTYTFTDKGDREVTLRPEMTPTVARMIAAKEKELAFPVRWYSIPNLFRYEKPQRGRLREHWQLNVDVFGIDTRDADIEVITVAYNIMKEFGASDTDFIIKLNSRKIMNVLYEKLGLNEDQSYKLSKLIDKKAKISAEDFASASSDIMGPASEEFVKLINSDEKLLDYVGETSEPVKNLLAVLEELTSALGAKVVFDPTLMRGFDYYTDIVFEVFDVNPANNRSLFGGGRYDDLTSLFGGNQISAFGFGMGDVTMRDFLETRGAIPEYKPATELSINVMDDASVENAKSLAQKLRDAGVNVVLNPNPKKPGKQKAQFVTLVGGNEVASGQYEIKNIKTGKKDKLGADFIAEFIKQNCSR